MSPSDISFLVYTTHINMLDALKSFGSSQYEHVDKRHIHRRETLLMCHSTPNTKLCQIFTVKVGPPHCHSHVESLVRIAFCVLWRIWGEALLDFRHENKAKCYRIFTVKLGNNSKHTWKASIKTTPIPKPNLKAQYV